MNTPINGYLDEVYRVESALNIAVSSLRKIADETKSDYWPCSCNIPKQAFEALEQIQKTLNPQ